MSTFWEVFVRALKMTYRHLGLLLVGNLLWFLLSIPLITFPAATMGLFFLAFHICNAEADNTEPPAIGHFFVGFRRFALVGFKLIGVDIGVFLFLLVAFLFYNRQDNPLLRLVGLPTFVALAFWVLVQLYLIPIMFRQNEQSVRLTFRNAIALALGNLGFSTGLMLLLLLVSALSAVLAGPILFVHFGFLAIAQTLAVQNLVPTMPRR